MDGLVVDFFMEVVSTDRGRVYYTSPSLGRDHMGPQREARQAAPFRAMVHGIPVQDKHLKALELEESTEPPWGKHGPRKDPRCRKE